MFTRWSQTLSGQHLSGYQTDQFANAAVQLYWLHGNGFNSLAYQPIFDALLQTPFRSNDTVGLGIYATDLPGHGHSSMPVDDWPNWRGMAHDVERVIQLQGSDAVKPLRLGVGHSLGSVVTLLQAYRYPQRFDRILLLDPVLFSPLIMAGQQTAKTLGLWTKLPLSKKALRRGDRWSSAQSMLQQLAGKKFYQRWHPQALSGFVEGGHRPLSSAGQPAEAVELACSPQWEARIFASYPKQLWQALKQIKIPVTIICANNSMPFVLRGAKRAASLNSNISYRIWGEGHCFPMEQPQQTAELIGDWIRADSA
ncbi:MAG: alpha/beta hydrolase [Motiliproteus sp.]